MQIMPDELDLFLVVLAGIAVIIIAFIVRAVRLTNASLATATRNMNLTNADVAGTLVEQLRGRTCSCPRCGQEAFWLLGTENRYTCDGCEMDFEGPSHLPGSSPR